MSSDILNQHLVGNGSNTQFTLLTSVANTSSVLVSINGLLSDPDIDYSVASNLITFTYAPYSTSVIEIRYLPSLTIGYTGSAGSAGSPGGYQGSVGFQGSSGFTGSAGAGGNDGYIGSFGYTGSKGYTGSIGSLGTPSDIQTIITDGTATYLLNKTPNNSKSILVAVNGLLQVPDVDYIVSGSNIVFNNIPPTGSDVEIIYFGNDVGYRGSEGFQGSSGFTGSAGAGGKDGYIGSFGYTGSKGYTGSAGIQGSIGYAGSGGWAAPSAVQVFLANGATSYSLSKIVAASKDILVSVNGLLQVPDNDYTVSGSTISFNTIPISTSDIEILYFDIAGYIGSQGYLGSVGYKGSTGDDGLPGFVGSRGFVGSSGYSGSIGYSGSKGDGGIAAPSDIQVFNSNNSVTYSLVKSVTSSKGIMVAVNGLLQVPDVDYSVSGTNLTFITQLQSNSDIEVIYFETAIGYQGSVGFVGSAGAPGGFTGYTGSKGTDGIIGYNGSAGYTGSKGYTGSVGIGYTGSAGAGGVGAPSQFQVLYGTANTNYTLNKIVANAKDILVSINGLLQIPDNDYTVSGTTINFVNAVGLDSDIEVLYFDVAGFIGSTGYKGSSGDPGGSTGYTGSTGYQGSLGFVGSVGFTGSIGIGYTGSMGPVGAPTNFQTFISQANQSTYNLNQDVAQEVSIIVTINGLVQVPLQDYTLATSNTINFTNTPDPNSDVEVLFFAASGFTGSRGLIGYQGSLGYIGSSGYQGTLGFAGSVGYKGSQGDPGAPIGYTGSSGFVGSTGYQGSIGYVGSTGSVGYTGSIGIGYTGSKGDSGYIGSSGNDGGIGYTGSKGDSGSIGYSGSIGIGYAGSKGDSGFQGSIGTIGYVGSIGTPGGVSFNYYYDNTTDDPNAAPVFASDGYLKYYSNSFFITSIDVGFSNTSSFIEKAINIVNNDIKGFMTVARTATPFDITVYSVGYGVYFAPALITGYHRIYTNYLSGNTVPYSNNEPLIISFTASGNRGYVGSTGAFAGMGYTGSRGIQGSIGYVGSQGIQGSLGPRGYTGSTPNPSAPVRQNFNGDGVTNTYSIDIGQNVNGYTPYQLDVYVNGIKLFNGIDVDVSTGNTVHFITPPGKDDNVEIVGSYIFSTNPDAAALFGPRGYTGSVGPPNGYTGSLGFTGYVGSKGDLGYTGSIGYTGSGINFRSYYNDTINYNINDLVEYDGSSYIAVGSSTANTPNSTSSYWQLFASKGYQGSRGYTGSTPNPSSPVRQNFNGDGTSRTYYIDIGQNVNGYTPYELDVYVNGIKLYNGLDVDVSSGNAIYFVIPPRKDDNIEVVGSYIFSTNPDSSALFGPRGYTGSSGLNGAGNSFTKIVVTGQSDLISYQGDLLQIVAGNNIILNTNNNSSPKTLTITSNANATGYGSNGQILVSNNGATYWASRFFSGNSSIVPLYPNYGDIWFSTEYNRPLVWANNGYFDTWYDFSSPSSI